MGKGEGGSVMLNAYGSFSSSARVCLLLCVGLALRDIRLLCGCDALVLVIPAYYGSMRLLLDGYRRMIYSGGTVIMRYGSCTKCSSWVWK